MEREENKEGIGFDVGIEEDEEEVGSWDEVCELAFPLVDCKEEDEEGAAEEKPFLFLNLRCFCFRSFCFSFENCVRFRCKRSSERSD